MIPPQLIAVALVVGLLALAPTRRLFLAGRSSRFIASYYGGLVALGVIVLVVPPLTRSVLPLLALLYLVPFLNWRWGLGRLMGRPPRIERPPMKNVTPRGDGTAEPR